MQMGDHFVEKRNDRIMSEIRRIRYRLRYAGRLSGLVSQKSNYGRRLVHATTYPFQAHKKVRDVRRFLPLQPQPLDCDNAPQKTDQKIGPHRDCTFPRWKIRLRAWS